MDSAFDLQRFVTAQDANGSYNHAVAELTRGRKTSHWMWYVFPQVAGLGRSSMSQKYAISSLDEAKAYLEHPVLGARLTEVTRIVADTDSRDPEDIFGMIDAQKLQSCMTLFLRAEPDQPLFQQVLDRYFSGHPDPRTDEILGA